METRFTCQFLTKSLISQHKHPVCINTLAYIFLFDLFWFLSVVYPFTLLQCLWSPNFSCTCISLLLWTVGHYSCVRVSDFSESNTLLKSQEPGRMDKIGGTENWCCGRQNKPPFPEDAYTLYPWKPWLCRCGVWTLRCNGYLRLAGWARCNHMSPSMQKNFPARSDTRRVQSPLLTEDGETGPQAMLVTSWGGEWPSADSQQEHRELSPVMITTQFYQ